MHGLETTGTLSVPDGLQHVIPAVVVQLAVEPPKGRCLPDVGRDVQLRKVSNYPLRIVLELRLPTKIAAAHRPGF